MTWLSTYPHHGRPTYTEHPTEAHAAAYCKWLIDSDTTRTATYFQIEDPS